MKKINNYVNNMSGLSMLLRKSSALLALTSALITGCSGSGTATSNDSSNQQGLSIAAPSIISSLSSQTSYGYLSVTNQNSATISRIAYAINQTVGGGNLVTLDKISAQSCALIKPKDNCNIKINIPAGATAGSFTVEATYTNPRGSTSTASSSTKTQQSTFIGISQATLEASSLSGINLTFAPEVNVVTSKLIVSGVVSSAAQAFNMVYLVDIKGNILPNQEIISGNLGSRSLSAGDTWALSFKLPNGITSQNFYLETATVDASGNILLSNVFMDKYTVKISHDKSIVSILPGTVGLNSGQSSQLATITNIGDTTATLNSITSNSTNIAVSSLEATKLPPGAETVVKISVANNASLSSSKSSITTLKDVSITDSSSITLDYNDGVSDTSQQITVIPSTFGVQYQAFTSVTPNNAGNAYSSCSVSESGILNCHDTSGAFLDNPYGIAFYGEHLYMLSTTSSNYLRCNIDLDNDQTFQCTESALVDSSNNNLLNGSVNSITFNANSAFIVSNNNNYIIQCAIAPDSSLINCKTFTPGPVDDQPVIDYPSGITIYGGDIFFINYQANQSNNSAPVLTLCISGLNDELVGCSPINFSTSVVHPVAVTAYKGYIYIVYQEPQELNGVLTNYSVCKITDTMDITPECSTYATGSDLNNNDQTGITFNNGFAYITNNDSNDNHNNFYTQCAIESPTGILTNCSQIDGSLDLPGGIAFIESSTENTYYIRSLDDYFNHLVYESFINSTAQSSAVGTSGSQVSLYVQESLSLTEIEYNFYSGNSCESSSLMYQKNYYPTPPSSYINIQPGIYTTTDAVNFGVCSSDAFILGSSNLFRHCVTEFEHVKSIQINYSFAAPGAGVMSGGGCMTNPANPLISGGGEVIANYENGTACDGTSNCQYSKAYQTSYYSLCNYSNESTFHNCQILVTQNQHNGYLSQFAGSSPCEPYNSSTTTLANAASSCGYVGANNVCQSDPATAYAPNATWHALLNGNNATVAGALYYQAANGNNNPPESIAFATGGNLATNLIHSIAGDSMGNLYISTGSNIGGVTNNCSYYSSPNGDNNVGWSSYISSAWYGYQTLLNNGCEYDETNGVGVHLYCVEQIIPPAGQ